MNKLYKLECILLSISVTLAIFTGVIFFFSTDYSYYHDKIIDNKVSDKTNISNDDLFRLSDALIDYLTKDDIDLNIVVDKNDVKIQAFSDNEIVHMRDVKVLFNILKITMIISFIMSIAFIIHMFYKKDRRKESLRNFSFMFVRCSLLFIVCVVIIAGFALTDFNRFWNLFHELIFTNDLWLLPSSSIMISICSLDVFSTLVFNSLIVAFIIYIVVFCLCMRYTIKHHTYI